MEKCEKLPPIIQGWERNINSCFNYNAELTATSLHTHSPMYTTQLSQLLAETVDRSVKGWKKLDVRLQLQDSHA